MRNKNKIFYFWVILSALFCFISIKVYAATTSGELSGDETWSGEVGITGDITVPAGVTLTVEPGTVIKFSALYDDTGGGSNTSRSELIIKGSLIAGGTETEGIVFTSSASSPAKNDWGGIYYTSRDPFSLKYVTIEYAGLGVDCRTSTWNASLAVENSIIRYTSGVGIYIYGNTGANLTVSVTNNIIYQNNNIGISIDGRGSNTVLSNTVTGNTVYENSNTGIYFYAQGSAVCTNTVTGNNVYDNSGYGVYTYTLSSARSTSTISNNEIYNNVTYGLYSYGYNGAQVSAEISGNIIYDSGLGICIYNYHSANSPSLEIRSNTVYNSTTGIYCRTYYNGASMSPLIESNNVYDNSGTGIRVYGDDRQSRNNPVIQSNTVTNCGGNGIQVQRHSDGAVLPFISLNKVNNNTGWGLYVQSNGNAKVLHNNIQSNGGHGLYVNSTGGANVNFNNIFSNSGDYELYNDSGAAVDAKYNWWGSSPTAQMDAGGNPKNITKIYDIYDNSGKGAVDYAAWLSGAQTIATDPISWVKDPINNSTMKAVSYTVTGAASALAGIERVEVSTDDGATWDVANGTEIWSYGWSIPGDGTYTIKSRVIASDATIETPGAGNTVTIDSSLPTTSGELSGDETWSGELKLEGDVIVPDGITLTILPGTVVGSPK